MLSESGPLLAGFYNAQAKLTEAVQRGNEKLTGSS
jgi:hypothetical protein